MLLNLLDEAGILGQNEVDCSSLSTETTSTADSVNVVLLLHGQLVVDNKTDLLHINTSGQQVSGNKHTDSTGSELLHHDFTLLLVHLTVHGSHDKVLGSHRLLELVHTSLGVTVDDGLLDVKVGVEVEQNIDLPLVLLDSDIVLMNTFEGEVFLLDENLGWSSHEMLGQAKNIGGQSGREEADLDVCGQELENVLDLWLETTREHLISLIKNEQLQVVSLEESSLHHVVDTSWCADNDVLTLLQNSNVLLNDGSSDASVHLDAEILTDRVNDESNLH